VDRLVNEWKVALPLHPEYDTRPNIYYVPPLSPHPLKGDMSFDTVNSRIPPEYLESLFGPKVVDALDRLKSEMAKVRDGGSSELMTTLIAYRWQELLGPFTADPADIIATG
jgi:nitrate reductase beta subunit